MHIQQYIIHHLDVNFYNNIVIVLKVQSWNVSYRLCRNNIYCIRSI